MNFGLELPFNIVVKNPTANIDERYGAYADIASALAATLGTRKEGLTVGITEAGKVVEYWFESGILDANLVKKIPAGGGNTDFQLQVDLSSTAAGNPGVGKIRFNNATQSSATALYLSSTEYDNGSIATLLANLTSGNTFSLKCKDSRGKWLVFQISSALSYTGYYVLNGVVTAFGAPLVNDDVVSFQINNGVTTAEKSVWNSKLSVLDSANSNLDMHTTSGHYVIFDTLAAKSPGGVSIATAGLLVFNNNSAAKQIQILYDALGSNMWMRENHAYVWSAWIKFYNSANDNVINRNIEFNPSNIVLNSKETYYNHYLQTGAINISSITNNYGIGASFLVPILTNSNSITIFGAEGKIIDNYANDIADYVLMISCTANGWIYSLVKPFKTPVEVALLSFYTTSGSSTTFDPTITTIAGVAHWDLDDSTFVDSNNIVRTYADSSSKLVKIFKGTMSGASDILTIDSNTDSIAGTLDLTAMTNLSGLLLYSNSALTTLLLPTSSQPISNFNVASCNLTGVLNVSGLLGLRTYFRVNSNPLLTGIILPITSSVFTTFLADSCKITGVLDLSGLTGLGGNVTINSNSLMTGVTFPTSSQIFTILAIGGCKITGVLNLSGLTGLGGNVTINSNSLMTGVTFPTSSQIFTAIIINNCNLTGTLDLSGLTGLGGSIQLYTNPLLTSVIFPTSSQLITSMSISICNITGTLNLSGLSGLKGSLQGSSNPLLTNISLPSNSNTFTSFSFSDCALGNIDFSTLPNLTSINNSSINLTSNAMTASEVDYNLAQLDAISISGFTGRIISISGSNATPTAAGLASRSSLISKGFTVNIS